MDTLDRRRFLTACVAATAASVAGCSRPKADAGDPYTEWMPASDGGAVSAYVDFTLSADESDINPILPLVVPGNDDSGDLAPTVNLDGLRDPLLTFPLRTGGRLLGAGALSLAVVGLGDLVDPARPTTGVTEIVFVDGVTVGLGDFETADVDERLRTGPERTRFEGVGERGEFTRYESVEGDGVAAVSDTALIVSTDRERFRAVLATWQGTRENAAAADDTFATLLNETDTGHVAVGWEGPVDLDGYTFGDVERAPAGGLVSTADDVVGSVTFEPTAGEMTADLAFRDVDGVDQTQLDARLGTRSTERTLSVDGDHVVVSGRYTAETVDIDFVAEETPKSTTVPKTVDPPPKVAAAVPDNTFEFTYDERERAVRVGFTKTVSADKVTVTAVESGFTNSTTTPEGLAYLSVQVDPSGDVVLVSVTVDGVSGVVARYDVP